MRRIRVLHVGKFYRPFRGGMETHLETLCHHLQPTVDVEVVVSAPGSRRTLDELVDGIPVRRLATPLLIRSAPWSPGLSSAIRASGADIVHLHLPHPWAAAAYLRSGHQGQLVVTYHSDIVRQRLLREFFAPVLHRLLRRADAIIVTSPQMLAHSPVLQRHTPRCRVVPMGIDLDGWTGRASEEAAELSRRYGRIVLGVGRLVAYKGFEHLVKAMRNVDAHLLLIGEGPLRGRLMRAARLWDVADRLSVLGRVENLAPYYQAAAVFALPSVNQSEAFGLVQLEAMACGTPVVNTALKSGVPSVSLHERTGLTVPPADSEALALALNRLLGDDVLRQRLGMAARERVEKAFTAASMAQRTLAVYNEILPSAPLPPSAPGPVD